MFKPMLATVVALAALMLWASAGGAHAQSPDSTAAIRTLQAARATGEMRIDGRLNEPVWEQAPVATDFTQNRPEPGRPATERTEVRVLYDEHAVYVGVRLYDSPDSIAAQLARRDAIAGTYSDLFFVMLDSYHDRRTAFNFGVNPRGVKVDLLFSDDSRRNLSWNAVWNVATQIDSLGWTAEFRIPLSQLRYNPEQTVWGLNFQRWIARKNESALWSPIPPDAPGLVSRFGDLVGLTGLASPTRLELEPYSVARVTRAPPGAPGDPFYRKSDLFGSAGMDFKYGISSSLTLTGTLNPDFGQVEADPSVVNLTAFESFFPEQRPFFVEGANLFDFDIGSGQLFYSRRIGRRPQGFTPGDALFHDIPEATTILGAVKLSGKTTGGWSLGVLDVVTAAEQARYVDADGLQRRAPVEPLTNYGVARVSRDFRNGQSALGGILTATNRRLEDGGSLGFLRSSAYSGGLDGRHRFGGNYEVRGSLVGSRVAGSTEAIGLVQQAPGRYFQRPDAGHLDFDPDRTALSGLAGNLFLGKIGGGRWGWGFLGNAKSPAFEVNDLGFQRQADEINGRVYVTYSQYEPGRLFRRSGIGVHTFGGWTFGGERVQTGFNTNGFFQLRNYWEGFFDVTPTLRALSTTALRGGPAIVEPAGLGFGAGFNTDRRKPLSGSVYLRRSTDEAGKRSLSLSPSLDLRPSLRIELSVGPTLSWNRDPAQYVGQRRLGDTTHFFLGHLEQTTTSLTARLDYTFTPALSLQFYAEPFISAGAYDRFREVADPRAGTFEDRFRLLSDEEVRVCEGFYGVRAQQDGCGEEASFAYRFGNPDFNIKRFNSNAVLRWEYRPGSTLFVVWNQGRRDFRRDGSFALDRDVGRLFGAESTNVLLVKVSYWFGL
jgi:hypothetical protein